MNYKQVSIKTARDNFSEIITRVALSKTNFVVTKFGKPKVVISAFSGLDEDWQDQQDDDKNKILNITSGKWSGRKDIKNTAQWVKKKRKDSSSRYEQVFS